MTLPRDPIAAVTHPDPYPYFADLVARKPVFRDESLGLWVASSADAVTAVLTSGLCRVRPPAEPVPRALLGSAAAEVFQRLVRMNDGPGHCPFKRAVSAALTSVDMAEAAEESRKWARYLSQRIAPQADHSRLQAFAFQLPVHVLAGLLGFPRDTLDRLASWTSDLVGGLASAGGAAAIERGEVAAGHLLEVFHALLAAREAGPAGGLLAALAREARLVGDGDMDKVAANGIGFLSQAYEATAGLIGNALLVLASHRDVREAVAADSGLLREAIQEVLRYDPPIQNTRRFIARRGAIAGQEMNEGEAILVVLAAANRDPSANPHPERFDLRRRDRRTFAFGVGAHACPGEPLSAIIAQAGVEALIESGLALESLAVTTYRPSVNARIPLFAGTGDRA